jgi:hypothetical protein
MTTPTAAISLTQIAALADLGPDFFARHRDELPQPVPLRTGAPGRPQLGYSVDELAALVAQRTGHLSEAICRLRIALASPRLRSVTDSAGRHHLVDDTVPLSELPADIAQAVLGQIRADRDANTNRRARPVTTEESQP